MKSKIALEESRDNYFDLYEFAPVGYLTLTDKGIITNANLTGAMLLGVDRSTLIRAPLSKCIAEKDADTWHRYFVNVRQQGEKKTCILTLTRGDGSVFPARLESIRLTGSEGTTTVRVAISDITDIRRAEEALRESEEKHRTLYDNMSEGFAYCRMIYTSDGQPEDFIYLNVNQAFDRITSTKTVTMKRVTGVYPGIRESYPELFVIYGRVASTGTPESFEINFKPIEKWLHISVYSPEKEYFVAVFEDITERKRAEEELRESKALVDAVVENVPLMIFLKEAKDLRFVIFNRAGEELLGYDRKALLGKNNLDLFPPEQAAHFMTKDRDVLDGELNLLDIPEE
ncbi:MAG: PAS domain S-box protein, partial [Methanoregula sp.]|nr:PAS domain S-box protein [Methanoregula sp.]